MTRTLVFLALGSNIAVFFIFRYPSTYAKVSAESVIRIPEPLLGSPNISVYFKTHRIKYNDTKLNKIGIVEAQKKCHLDLFSIFRNFISVNSWIF